MKVSAPTSKIDDVPAELEAVSNAARERAVEAAADSDESLMALYLEGAEIPADHLRKALREATLQLRVVPVVCGSAFKNKGIQPLLDSIVAYLPSPLDVPPVEGIDLKKDEPATRKADDSEPFAALVFKLMSDKHVGHLTYLRVYSGSIEAGQQVLNVRRDRKERVGRLLQMHANKRQEIPAAYAGDIIAVVGFKSVSTGDTLCDPRHPIALEAMAVPGTGDLDRDRTEDPGRHGPARRVARAARPGRSVLPRDERSRNRPDDHLRHGRAAPRDHLRPPAPGVPCRRQRRAAAGRVQGNDPKTVRAEGRYIKQTGGSGDYGVVVLEVSPNEAGKGFEFIDATKGAPIPREFVPAIRQGAEEALQSGELAGYPGRRRARAAARRPGPRRRLVGAIVQDRRLDRRARGDAAGAADAARADHEGRGGDAGRFRRRRYRAI